MAILDLAIIGGGLSGLALAAQLSQQAPDKRLAVFEANNRLGGRILSTPLSSESPHTSESPNSRFDLGPTWIWPDDQSHIRQFAIQHQLPVFPQYQRGQAVYKSALEQPTVQFPDQQGYRGAYRIEGGVERLIEILQRQIPTTCIHLHQRLTALLNHDDRVELVFNTPNQNELRLQARKVVLCLPPRLVSQQIQCEPPLDNKLKQLLDNTPTWMAGHAKAIIQYPTPFWRQQGLSGNGFAQYPGAMLGEIFDACNADTSQAALGGFFALPTQLRQQYRQDLPDLIVEQLCQLFGPQAASPDAIHIQDWFRQDTTAVAADANLPTSHPDYGHPWLRLDHWSNKLWFGSSETDPAFGGYLEGALRAASRIAAELLTDERLAEAADRGA
ncbi:flavin monoamine oxidase family protein [Oceanobacter mangrovi]|uniref:flavin monoamine oxidase family protein n=1 Tax=Oceanobacter mangrovi TaxID=2862510 RepID=UPI001C8D66F1|nr:FAD-dependent oxidoreductase [Oceanobacter mangrovi]